MRSWECGGEQSIKAELKAQLNALMITYRAAPAASCTADASSPRSPHPPPSVRSSLDGARPSKSGARVAPNRCLSVI